MQSLFSDVPAETPTNPDSRAEPVLETTPIPDVPSAGDVTPQDEQPGEFEIVLGRGQVAVLLFLVLMVLAVFSGLSYFTGRKVSAAATAPRAPVAAKPLPAAPLPVAQVPVVKTPEKAAAPAPIIPISNEPVFRDPKPGEVFLQMAAVEKGVAGVFAEGLRRMGFPSIVAPGPSERIYRVLIGPVKGEAQMSQIRKSLDAAGLSTFLRRWEVGGGTAQK